MFNADSSLDNAGTIREFIEHPNPAINFLTVNVVMPLVQSAKILLYRETGHSAQHIQVGLYASHKPLSLKTTEDTGDMTAS